MCKITRYIKWCKSRRIRKTDIGIKGDLLTGDAKFKWIDEILGLFSFRKIVFEPYVAFAPFGYRKLYKKKPILLSQNGLWAI